MSVSEIQNDLIRKILQTENLQLLKRLQELFSLPEKELDWWNTISDEEKKLIEIGEKELEAGLGIPHEEVRKEINERFKKYKK